MKYYVTIQQIKEQLQTSTYQARKIFHDAKCVSKSIFSQREVPTRAVNQIVGYKAFPTPEER